MFDNELFHGFNAGIGQSLVGHPLDTYKIWIQSKHRERITLSNLYRGFSYPAFTNGIITGLSFKIYTHYKNNDSKYGMLIGGFYTGCITALLCAYPEYKKISCQLNMKKRKFPYQTLITLSLREIPGGIFYYPVYDILRNNNINVPVSGGFAGVTCWLSSYWADVLNTNVVNGLCLKQTIKTLKFIDYFKGLEVVLPRAFFVNAVGYYFYEFSKSMFY